MDTSMPGAEMQPLLAFILWLFLVAIIVIPFWFILSKAGYSKWLSLLMLVPILNLVLLYFLAFSKWPILKDKN